MFRSVSFGGTGSEPEEGVDGATSKQTGNKWHDARPTPRGLRADEDDANACNPKGYS